MPIIRVDNLTKVYRINQKDPGLSGAVKALFRPRHINKVAVDHIHFSVEPGEVVGYIGVNGAGKSTTIKLLTGILMPSAGQVQVMGRDPHRQRVANARDIGVVFGQRSQLWWDLALIESLNLVARIYDVDPARYKQLLDQFSETLELKDLLRVPIRNMSLGQKMRAELAATLIHEPKVVYLDEPTIGLDLIVKERIREFIKEQNRTKGTTVILTTHDLGDIEELCRRVIIIDNGRLIYDGPISTIKDRFGKYRTITFDTLAPVGQPGTDFNIPEGAELVTNGHSAEDRKLVLRFDRTVTSASRVAASLMNEVEVTDFSLSEPGLASIIKQIYNGALAEAEVSEADEAGSQPLSGGHDQDVFGRYCEPSEGVETGP
ncbi:MAG: ATP-binding cassette domain-containing protein [Chloroflexota bacterium]|nr:MAG: ATP-binding cassette domain-containing protein [Chloroflexota bacterium]